ncbi:MAG: hypothetical protein OXF49_00445 [Candidatus Saccharibacteria bacterium]|nr:hypothetical protein [Candidatus Saccharibacteria bacterium]
MPNLYISEFLEKHRRDYYEALNLVSVEGDWIYWISFFLQAVRQQAKTSKKTVEQIEELHREMSQELPKFNSKYASAFLEALFKMPIFSLKGIAKRAGITNSQTAYSLLDKFLAAGLVDQLNENPMKTKRILVFNKLLTILD